jgi:hypothetical protein
MASCRNCDGHVTDAYARVFAPEDVEADGEVRVCPNCSDAIREAGEVREPRSVRRVDQNHDRGERADD